MQEQAPHGVGVTHATSAHQQQVRLPGGTVLRCHGAAGKVLHSVRARQAVRKGQLQELRRRCGGRLGQQQSEAGCTPCQRSDASL